MMRWLLLIPFTLMAFDCKSSSAVLMDVASGKILYEKNADTLAAPASITKVATALYACHVQSAWDEVVEAPKEVLGTISSAKKKRGHYCNPPYWLEVGAVHMDIKPGERLPFSDLLGAMLVTSANDAANVVAYHCGNGSVERFMQKMNRYLKSIGCTKTHFENPHGIYMPNHRTTARDMALIARQFLLQPRLMAIVECCSWTVDTTNKHPERTFAQTNALIKRGKWHYPHAIGIKTGYTKESKRTLVAAARKGKQTFIVVLLGAEEKDDLYRDAKALFEKGFN